LRYKARHFDIKEHYWGTTENVSNQKTELIVEGADPN